MGSQEVTFIAEGISIAISMGYRVILESESYHSNKIEVVSAGYTFNGTQYRFSTTTDYTMLDKTVDLDVPDLHIHLIRKPDEEVL